MSDIVQVALKYHQQMKNKLAKVEEFLRFAEELSEASGPEDCLTLQNATAKPTPPENRTIKPSRSLADGAAATQVEPMPASRTNGSGS